MISLKREVKIRLEDIQPNSIACAYVYWIFIFGTSISTLVHAFQFYIPMVELPIHRLKFVM